MLTIPVIISFLIASVLGVGNETIPLCTNQDLSKLSCECLIDEIKCTGTDSVESDDSVWNLLESVPEIKILSFYWYFEHVPTEMLASLENLEVYKCSGTLALDIPEHSFKNLQKIEIIELSRNQLITIERHAFQNLPNLKELNLHGNKIKTINDEAFIGLPKLERFELHYNNIEELPNHIFNGFTMLKYLDLRRNHIKTLNSDLLTSIRLNFLPDKTFFSVMNNPLECDCRMHWTYQFIQETKSYYTKLHGESTNCTLSNDTSINLLEYLSTNSC